MRNTPIDYIRDYYNSLNYQPEDFYDHYYDETYEYDADAVELVADDEVMDMHVGGEETSREEPAALSVARLYEIARRERRYPLYNVDNMLWNFLIDLNSTDFLEQRLGSYCYQYFATGLDSAVSNSCLD